MPKKNRLLVTTIGFCFSALRVSWFGFATAIYLCDMMGKEGRIGVMPCTHHQGLCMPLISQRVELARNGANDKVICRMASGWAVMGDVQFLPGYCLLLPDPVVPSLNDLDAEARTAYLLDMARMGDAVLQATGALRMNYEILGNSEPELHCHIFPRYASEPEQHRTMPVWFYDWKTAIPYSEETHGDLRKRIAQLLDASS